KRFDYRSYLSGDPERGLIEFFSGIFLNTLFPAFSLPAFSGSIAKRHESRIFLMGFKDPLEIHYPSRFVKKVLSLSIPVCGEDLIEKRDKW
ncbi:MAG: hypothetical protein ACQXXC_08900, partial [Methanolinea tarda]